MQSRQPQPLPLSSLESRDYRRQASVAVDIRDRVAEAKLGDTILETYPDVSQFWTYDPKWFLEQLVYSRDYPAAKNLE